MDQPLNGDTPVDPLTSAPSTSLILDSPVASSSLDTEHYYPPNPPIIEIDPLDTTSTSEAIVSDNTPISQNSFSFHDVPVSTPANSLTIFHDLTSRRNKGISGVFIIEQCKYKFMFILNVYIQSQIEKLTLDNQVVELEIFFSLFNTQII
ncbi:hypothetical protein K501DRAFT_272341 [Backusella circina FSU 941]|nr:hypothetical protein K501DRAFT_272341 [Backusella circina FSU 941]